MEWLLFIIIIGSNGPYVGNNGAPVAKVSTEVYCEDMGRVWSRTLSERALLRGVTVTHKCVRRTGA